MEAIYVKRTFYRAENDDFKLNVEHLLTHDPTLEAIPQYDPDQIIDPLLNPDQIEYRLIGWKIQSKHE